MLVQRVARTQDGRAQNDPGQQDDGAEEGAKEADDEGMHGAIQCTHDHRIGCRKDRSAYSKDHGHLSPLGAAGFRHNKLLPGILLPA
ncbi:hypothetical protein D9M72_531320 [compost metagenome]